MTSPTRYVLFSSNHFIMGTEIVCLDVMVCTSFVDFLLSLGGFSAINCKIAHVWWIFCPIWWGSKSIRCV